MWRGSFVFRGYTGNMACLEMLEFAVERRWLVALAVLMGCTACFPRYSSEDEAAQMTVELPDGPTPCGNDECSASEVCIQPGRRWQGADCELVDVPAFCAPRLDCDDLVRPDFEWCQAGDRCSGSGCSEDPSFEDGVLHCNDTACHCPNAYDEDTD